MSEFWQSVLSGIVVALIWAAILYGYSKWQEKAIEKMLSRQFPRTFSHNLQGWGMVIKNTTAIEIVIRQFCLVGAPVDGQGSSTFSFWLAANHSDKAVTVTADRWIVMPPYTEATLNVPQDPRVKDSGMLGQLKGARLTIEYKNLVGQSKLLVIQPPFSDTDQRDMASSFTKVLTGEMDAAMQAAQRQQLQN